MKSENQEKNQMNSNDIFQVYIYIHTIFRGNLAVLTEQARHKKCHRYILTYMSEVKEAADPTL